MVLVRCDTEDGLQIRDCQAPEISRFNEAAEKWVRDSGTGRLGLNSGSATY